MNKRAWLIPILIVAANALAIILRWHHLSEVLPAHFDLQGNAGGMMQRSILPFYPLAGVLVCLLGFLLARRIARLQTGLIILTSGICLVVLLSTFVTLTSGKMPVFMLAEPVVLLAAVIASVICIVRYRKR
jgi:hypothetical protein